LHIGVIEICPVRRTSLH